MAHRLHEHEDAPEDERRDRGERELRRSCSTARRALVVNAGSTSDSVASAISAASAECAPSMRNACSWCLRPPASRHRPTTPLQMIMIAEKIVSRGSVGLFGAAGEHHRDDQRDLDHRDRDREDQRAERLADAMRDDLGVMHRRQHRADERRRAQGHDDRVERHHEGRGEQQRGRDGQHEGPPGTERVPAHGASPGETPIVPEDASTAGVGLTRARAGVTPRARIRPP